MTDTPNISPARITLAPNLDMRASGPLAAALLAVRGANLEVDAGEVERVGALCLQVLLSARTTWSADERAFQIVEPTPSFLDGVQALGAEPFQTTSEQEPAL